jgi:hypothetical protein
MMTFFFLNVEDFNVVKLQNVCIQVPMSPSVLHLRLSLVNYHYNLECIRDSFKRSRAHAYIIRRTILNYMSPDPLHFERKWQSQFPFIPG